MNKFPDEQVKDFIWKFINLVNNFCGKVNTENQKNNPYFY